MRSQKDSSSFIALTDQPAARRKRIRNLVILVLLISIGVHVVAGVGAAIWVIARYFAQPKAQFVMEKVKMPTQKREHRLAMEEVSALRPRTTIQNRIQSIRPTTLALPELPKIPVETSVPLDVEAMVSDQIDGVGQVASAGTGNASGGFFGGAGMASSGFMEGTFYDLKQTKDGQTTDMSVPGPHTQDIVIPLFRNFSKNWNPAPLRKYFQGPDKLYASQLSIPVLSADVGPKEFGLGNKVQPRYWVVHYKGRVIAPKSGQFRFVGAGDDTLLVRFDRKNVLDAGFWPTWRPNKAPVLNYDNNLFQATGCDPGYIVGETFRVEAGKAYDIEILISEYGGGLFQAVLLIQDMDTEYRKFPKTDAPILPFFKLTPSNAEAKARGKLPPYDRNAPIWRPASAAESLGTP